MTSLQVVKKEFMKQTVNNCRYFKIILSAQFVNLLLTVRLLTRQGWLKASLPPTAVNSLAKMNGHQTLQTLALLIIMSGELCLNVTRHFIRSRRTLTSWKSLAANMESAAAGLNQQGHTELHKKTSSLCES